MTATVFTWPAGITAGAAFTFDVDAESAVVGTNPALAKHLSIMSHQAYGPRVGVPRILRILDEAGVHGTFFVPGLTAELHPDTIRTIADAGHEIAGHGYLHEVPTDQSSIEHRDTVLRGLDALEAVIGVRPVGYRAPMWSLREDSPEILIDAGIQYDSSMMDGDHPYLLGSPSGSLVEFPVSWSLDDWEPYAFLPGFTGCGVIEDPVPTTRRWYDEFAAMKEDNGLFVLTCHPFLSGRPARARALSSLIRRIARPDVWSGTLAELARQVREQDLPARTPVRVADALAERPSRGPHSPGRLHAYGVSGGS